FGPVINHFRNGSIEKKLHEMAETLSNERNKYSIERESSQWWGVGRRWTLVIEAPFVAELSPSFGEKTPSYSADSTVKLVID
ncbi:hypothetical protein HDU91_001121, partial [Kappamyces sp. JEL0680]